MQKAIAVYPVVGEVTILKEFSAYDSKHPSAEKIRLRHGTYTLLSKKMRNGRGTWWVVISDSLEVGFPPNTWKYYHDAQLCYLHEKVGAVVISPQTCVAMATASAQA